MYKLSFDIKILSLCNMNCSYCASHSNNKYILPIEKIINYINRIYKSLNINCFINVVILGGEVTLLPEGYLTELIDKLNSIKKIGNIHIYTNFKSFSNELNIIVNENDNVYINLSYDTINDKISDRNISLDNILDTLNKYNLKNRIIIHSVLNNITISHYHQLLDLFILNDIKIFRFKIERNLGRILYTLNTFQSYKKYIVDNILLNSKYLNIKFVSNMILNTILVNETKFDGDTSIMYQLHKIDSKPEKMMRNTFFDIDINKNQLFELYR